MADVDKIIEQILAASRAKGGRALSSARTYADEPILLRGSQLSSYLPDKIREMRALARRPEARPWSEARLFVKQARLMEDFEDDCPYAGTFQAYFPTYEAMDNSQLRGYFTWRAQVRRGVIEKTSLSFAYVYLYELLNGIGTAPGLPAFRAIESFWQGYRAFDSSLDRYVRPWLVDYVVYHGLDPALARPYANAEHNRAIALLARAEKALLHQPVQKRRRRAPYPFGENPDAEERLLAALDELSTYRLGTSRLYRDDPEALRSVSCAVFARLVRYYHTGRSQDLVENLFGTCGERAHLMFASAVFHDPKRHPDCAYELDETCHFTCRSGIWACETYHDGGARSAKLGQILRATDRQLRMALGYPHPLKDRADPKYLVQLIDREASDFIAWRAAHAAHHVEIDLSKLAGIRAGAAITREALLVDEEREEEPEMAAVGTAKPSSQAHSPAAAPGSHAASPAAEADDGSAPCDLIPDELVLLRTLLDGETPSGANVDLLVDAINEKLFDLVGDTVIEFDENGRPRLVEDYLDEVRDLL